VNLGDLQGQPILLPGFEAGRLNLNVEGGCGKAIDAEVATVTGQDGVRNAQTGIGDGDLRFCDDSSCCVVHDALNSA